MARGSSGSGNELTGRDLAAIFGAALAGMAAYLVTAARTYRLGFPLDDSWIHATYARNLALNQEWAFQLGQPSAGSTSPLWILALTPGYIMRVAPPWWSYLLGLVALVGLGAVAESMLRRLARNYRPRAPWVGLLMATEWHMLWAAASGMETLLYATIVTLLLTLLMTGSGNFAAMGVLSGLSVWVRPDGLALVAPVLLAIALSKLNGTRRMRGLTSYLLAVGALLVPYLAFNLYLSGAPMPNTFYAKQAEYAAWQSRPLMQRVGIGLGQLSIGPLVLLWPGVFIVGVRVARQRNVAITSALMWAAGHTLVYVLRLPPYQHGRYLMPAMPILLLLGILGCLDWLRQVKIGKYGWAVAWAWKTGLVLLSAGFLVLGARGYGEDVAVIESEMVNTATWVQEHIPADALVAAHDIGALGYFDQHVLIDLAGLISPEVVPFIRDESMLAAYLDRRGAEYLIAFPALYPDLAAASKPIYVSSGGFAPAAGEGNMTVYCWRCR